MSIAGILIPVPVPSSLIIIYFTSLTPVLSMITAKEPPAFSMFLTFVTKWQLPLSTRKIGVRMPSGSPVKSVVKFVREQPSLFSLL